MRMQLVRGWAHELPPAALIIVICHACAMPCCAATRHAALLQLMMPGTSEADSSNAQDAARHTGKQSHCLCLLLKCSRDLRCNCGLALDTFIAQQNKENKKEETLGGFQAYRQAASDFQCLPLSLFQIQDQNQQGQRRTTVWLYSYSSINTSDVAAGGSALSSVVVNWH